MVMIFSSSDLCAQPISVFVLLLPRKMFYGIEVMKSATCLCGSYQPLRCFGIIEKTNQISMLCRQQGIYTLQ